LRSGSLTGTWGALLVTRAADNWRRQS